MNSLLDTRFKFITPNIFLSKISFVGLAQSFFLNVEDFSIGFVFVWFYGAPTLSRLYGAVTGKVGLVSLGCYKLKATPGVIKALKVMKYTLLDNIIYFCHQGHVDFNLLTSKTIGDIF
jgi:hypothetical protein